MHFRQRWRDRREEAVSVTFFGHHWFWREGGNSDWQRRKKTIAIALFSHRHLFNRRCHRWQRFKKAVAIVLNDLADGFSQIAERFTCNRGKKSIPPMFVWNTGLILEESEGRSSVDRNRLVLDNPPGAMIGNEIDLIGKTFLWHFRDQAKLPETYIARRSVRLAQDFKIADRPQLIKQIGDALPLGRDFGRQKLNIKNTPTRNFDGNRHLINGVSNYSRGRCGSNRLSGR